MLGIKTNVFKYKTLKDVYQSIFIGITHKKKLFVCFPLITIILE